jgi:AcrR family transcriptional regulator
MALSKEMIVTVSIEILNRDGIKGLSMRTIAKELGVKAASLYWHVNGKPELYGAIAEYLCSEIILPADLPEAEAYLSEVCQRYRAMLLGTKDAVAIQVNSISNTPKRLEIIAAVNKRLLEMGVKKKNLLTAANLLNNYVLSFTADEIRFKNTPPQALKTLKSKLKPEKTGVLRGKTNFDEQFLYGLRVVFAGLDAAEHKKARRPQPQPTERWRFSRQDQQGLHPVYSLRQLPPRS